MWRRCRLGALSTPSSHKLAKDDKNALIADDVDVAVDKDGGAKEDEPFVPHADQPVEVRGVSAVEISSCDPRVDVQQVDNIPLARAEAPVENDEDAPAAYEDILALLRGRRRGDG